LTTTNAGPAADARRLRKDAERRTYCHCVDKDGNPDPRVIIPPEIGGARLEPEDSYDPYCLRCGRKPITDRTRRSEDAEDQVVRVPTEDLELVFDLLDDADAPVAQQALTQAVEELLECPHGTAAGKVSRRCCGCTARA
jgi:hypothetical protein